MRLIEITQINNINYTLIYNGTVGKVNESLVALTYSSLPCTQQEGFNTSLYPSFLFVLITIKTSKRHA